METWLTPPLIISLLALALSVFNSHYGRKKDDTDKINKRFETLEQRMTEVETSLKVLSKQMELFWRTVEQQMAKKFRDE